MLLNTRFSVGIGPVSNGLHGEGMPSLASVFEDIIGGHSVIVLTEPTILDERARPPAWQEWPPFQFSRAQRLRAQAVPGFYSGIPMDAITPVGPEPGDTAVDIANLRRENPQGYGYLVRYWEDAKQGLDNTDRNYAQVDQIHEHIPAPRIGTRGLGQTLVLLAELDVLTVLTTRSNATIYDLTTYDPDRLSAIGRLLGAQ